MLIAGKIAASLLLPPGFILLGLVVMAFYFGGRRRWEPAVWALGFSILLYLSACPALATWMVSRLENQISPLDAPADADVLIVLGSGIVQGSPEEGGAPLPSLESLKRLDAALRWQRKTGLPILVSGGVVFREESAVAEGEVMARFLIRQGVPPSQILIESKSRNTEENAIFSRDLLAKKGLHKPLVISSAWHLPRAVVCFRRAGLTMTPLPVAYRTDRPLRHSWRDFLPSAAALSDLQLALREMMGRIWLELRPFSPHP